MKKPTLLVLAAGMGSRYGALKQMDGVGPAGEAILDYSVYDAVRAGFGKVVFVIRHSFADDFRAVFNAGRFGGRIEVDYVFQELDYLPAGMTVPEGRTKPWGTNHAVMMGAKAIDGPFAAINADDFYGRDAFAKIGGFLRPAEGHRGEYCMVGYRLANTLSEHGSVSRGVCEVDSEGYLRSMVERTAISRTADGQIEYEADGKHFPLDDDTVVSMNFFGFTPDYFMHSYDFFETFYRENRENMRSEFYIPLMVNRLVNSGEASMKVLPTDSQWFGVTYKEDKPEVEARIRALIAAGEYPEKLWK
ncbi:MAG: nucleotidyltransferase [Rikenellaceae bacterium]|nr:nucleotidyltransferase [Rikenellaceae bacterium]MCL2693359.1 nucleotidyltransferase [Rikenellaceae bacterium]